MFVKMMLVVCVFLSGSSAFAEPAAHEKPIRIGYLNVEDSVFQGRCDDTLTFLKGINKHRARVVMRKLDSVWIINLDGHDVFLAQLGQMAISKGGKSGYQQTWGGGEGAYNGGGYKVEMEIFSHSPCAGSEDCELEFVEADLTISHRNRKPRQVSLSGSSGC